MVGMDTETEAYLWTQECYAANPKAIKTEMEKAYILYPSRSFDQAWYVALMWGQGDSDAMERIYKVAMNF